MLIRELEVSGLHGYINKKIRFHEDVNILIGINGSGKTSILNALFWTLSPQSWVSGELAARRLSGLLFDSIRIRFTNPPQTKPGSLYVTAKRTNEIISINITHVDGHLTLPDIGQERHSFSRRDLLRRNPDDEVDFIFRHLQSQSDNPVLATLSELGDTLYLPLDRRWAGTAEPQYPPTRRRRMSHRGQTPTEAVYTMAVERFREERRHVVQASEELRRKMILSIFEVIPDSPNLPDSVLTPEEIRAYQTRIIDTLERIEIRDLSSTTDSIFSQLLSISERIAGKSFDDSFSHGSEEQRAAWLELFSAGGTVLFTRIDRLIALIEEYEQAIETHTVRTRRFLQSVNSFLRDSDKSIAFDSIGNIEVQLPRHAPFSADFLSSGELQLLTLFAYLYFTDASQEQFPVIIDEPEISLHLEWQSKFIESVRTANPKCQLIIATHSPEIVGTHQDKCIDISP